VFRTSLASLKTAIILGLVLLSGAIVLFAPSGCRKSIHTPQRLNDTHWFKPTSDAVISSPVAWDLDGDGVKEIAIGAWDGYFYVLDHQLNDLPGWPKFSRGGFFSSPALADLDKDGHLDIIVGSEAGKLFAWKADGDAVDGFPVDLGYKLWASPTILGGWQDDTSTGIYVAIGANERMFIIDASGQRVTGWPQPMFGWPDATAAFGSGLLAVTTLTPGDPSRGWLYAWSVDSALLPGFPIELSMDSDSSPALAGLDGDGRAWIIVGDDAGNLHVVDTGGRQRTGFPVQTVGPGPGPTPTPHPPGGNIHSIEASPAVADLDGDGHLEIAVGSWDGRMYLWDDLGRPLPGWPVRVQDQIISSAALVDLDGDDRLDIVVGSKDGHLYGWTVEGRPLAGFPVDLGEPVFSSPWVGDLDDDGMADIVVGANNGIHVLREVGRLGRQAWPMFHRDAARTGAPQ
jgi:hypothetical protein